MVGVRVKMQKIKKYLDTFADELMKERQGKVGDSSALNCHFCKKENKQENSWVFRCGFCNKLNRVRVSCFPEVYSYADAPDEQDIKSHFWVE